MALIESVYLLLFLAGLGLMVAEAAAPGAHVFVLGIGLTTAGAVGMLVPASLGPLQPVVVGVVSLAVTLATLYFYRQVAMTAGESIAETSDSDSLRGQFGTVTERITEDGGAVKLRDGGFDPTYQARSTDGTIEAGEEVMVVDPGGGNVLTVEPVAGRDEIDRELADERSDEEIASDAGETSTDGGATVTDETAREVE